MIGLLLQILRRLFFIDGLIILSWACGCTHMCSLSLYDVQEPFIWILKFHWGHIFITFHHIPTLVGISMRSNGRFTLSIQIETLY